MTGLGLGTTPYQPPDDPAFPALAFHVASLAKDGGFMERWKSGVDEGVYAAGTVTVTRISVGVAPVPEPPGVIALGLRTIGIGLAWRGDAAGTPSGVTGLTPHPRLPCREPRPSLAVADRPGDRDRPAAARGIAA